MSDLVDPITIKSINLKCDACDYAEPVASIDASLIDKPCPQCGANLLTREDYAGAVALRSLWETINAAVGPVKASGKAELIAVNPHKGEFRTSVKRGAA